ncbi:MAG: glycosyltransferase [Lentisphaeria bacterium]
MPDQPLRICHLITRMIVGGAQENTLLSARGQAADGHAVTLATGPSPGPEGRLLDRMAAPGVTVAEIPHLIREVRPWHDALAYRRLVRFFREQRFDVVHTHSSKAGILGRLAARRAGVPLVVHTVHGQAFHAHERWWRNRLFILAERRAARAADRIFAVCQAMVDQCVAAGVAPAAKYQVVYSGMELEPYLAGRRDPELRRQLGIPEHAPVVGKIARLFELKGHDCLLAAAAQVLREVPETRFLLVGDGLLRPALEAQAVRLGIRDRIVFAGLVSPAEVPRYVAQMDMVAHLSLREGLPRAVIQAFAAGLPAVGYPLDGTPEVIRDGETGRLCPVGDATAVAAALLALLRSPQPARAMGAAGRALAVARFDWRRMVADLEAAYRAGLAAARPK